MTQQQLTMRCGTTQPWGVERHRQVTAKCKCDTVKRHRLRCRICPQRTNEFLLMLAYKGPDKPIKQMHPGIHIKEHHCAAQEQMFPCGPHCAEHALPYALEDAGPFPTQLGPVTTGIHEYEPSKMCWRAAYLGKKNQGHNCVVVPAAVQRVVLTGNPSIKRCLTHCPWGIVLIASTPLFRTMTKQVSFE